MVDTANDGIAAVEKVASSPSGSYDLVLMDIQMPNMDGYTATREIRKLPDSSKADIPIVAMTANAFDEDKEKAFTCGMNGFISKPINIKILISTLKTIFK